MKAWVYTSYGGTEVLQLREVENPVPKDNEVLLKVRAGSVNALDWRLMRGKPSLIRLIFGLTKPKFKPGRDVSGKVESVGSKVTLFKPGDEVFGVCNGSFAEYACADESKIALKPRNLSFEEAASIPIAGLTALQGLRDRGHIQAGQKVLIDGAGGGVGTFAVQLAKFFGADVTATCGSGNLEMIRANGANRVIDYAKENVTQSGQIYDLILCANGYHSLRAYKKILKPNGILMVAGGSMSLFIPLMLAQLIPGKMKIGIVPAKIIPSDLTFIAEQIAAGKFKPAIEKNYPFNEAAEAIGHLERGHTKGKVVVTVSGV